MQRELGWRALVDDALFTALGAARIDQCVAPSGGGAYSTGSNALIELGGTSRVVNSTAALDASDSTRSGGVHAASDSRVLIASSAAVLQNHAAYGGGLSLVDGGSARVLGTSSNLAITAPASAPCPVAASCSAAMLA